MGVKIRVGSTQRDVRIRVGEKLTDLIRPATKPAKFLGELRARFQNRKRDNTVNRRAGRHPAEDTCDFRDRRCPEDT
eukprot:2355101-Rhodomonas_salina.2